MNPAVLLDHERAVPTLQPLRVRVGEVRVLFERARGRVPRPHVHGPVPVAQEPHASIHPHGLDVGGPLVGEPGLLESAQIEDRQRGVLPTPVASEFLVPARHPVDHQASAVRGEVAVVPPRRRKQLRRPARHRHRPQSHVPARRGPPGRRVQDARPVRAPPADLRLRRVPGQPLRHAPVDRHDVDRGRPRSVRRERDPASVGRDVRIALDRRRGGDALRLATRPVHDPDVGAPGEGDVGRAQARLPEESCGLLGFERDRKGEADRQQDDRGREAADAGHEGLRARMRGGTSFDRPMLRPAGKVGQRSRAPRRPGPPPRRPRPTPPLQPSSSPSSFRRSSMHDGQMP